MLIAQVVNGLVVGGIYVLVSLGFTLVFGVSRIINFAHGELMMLGAYLTFILVTVAKLPIVLSVVIAMLLMMLVGAGIERAVFRPIRNREMTAALLASTGLMIALRNLAQVIWGAYPRTMQTGLSGVIALGSLTISYQRLLIMVLTAALVFGLYLFLYRTKTGKAIRAVAQNKEGASYVGIDIDSISLVVFAVSSLLAAAGGASLGVLFSVEPNMGFAPLLKAFAVVVLGGLGSVSGAVIGGLGIGVMESLVTGYISIDYKDVFAFILMIAILVLKPSGLFGEEEA